MPAIPLMLYFRLVEKKPVLDPVWPLNRPDKLKMVGIILVSTSMNGIAYLTNSDAQVHRRMRFIVNSLVPVVCVCSGSVRGWVHVLHLPHLCSAVHQHAGCFHHRFLLPLLRHRHCSSPRDGENGVSPSSTLLASLPSTPAR